jgi:hypothetical protein
MLLNKAASISLDQAAIKQKAGRIITARRTKDVAFEPMQGAMNDRIDDACREKYKGSPYLKPMIGDRARSATAKDHAARPLGVICK